MWPSKRLTPLFHWTIDTATGSTPETAEFVALLRELFPGEQSRRIACREFRLWLNAQTGVDVPNGTLSECVRQWLPRLREMAA
jgi:hypothetical protein